MNAAHIHILLVHLPVLGAYFGLILLLYGWAFNKQEALRISFGTFFVVGLFSVIVYLTGGAAEEIVEDIAGVMHDDIEAHENVAVAALVSGIVLGITGVVGMLVSIRRTVLPRWLTVTAVVIGIVSAGIMARTAYLGGQINHPEIQSEQQAVQSSAGRIDAPSRVTLPSQ